MNRYEWHPWFAWYPVRLTTHPDAAEPWMPGFGVNFGERRWMRWVETRDHGNIAPDGQTEPWWQYRDPDCREWCSWFSWRRVRLTLTPDEEPKLKNFECKGERRWLRRIDRRFVSGHANGQPCEWWQYRDPLIVTRINWRPVIYFVITLAGLASVFCGCAPICWLGW